MSERHRIQTEQPLEMENRRKARRLAKVRDQIEALKLEEAELLKDLTKTMERHSTRLLVPVPSNAIILDILELVEVVKPNYWLWHGMTNNKGLPTVRYRTDGSAATERSVVRVLAEAFGVVDEDWEGILYPLNGTDNVNPWQREKREYPEGKYRGKHDRYKF